MYQIENESMDSLPYQVADTPLETSIKDEADVRTILDGLSVRHNRAYERFMRWQQAKGTNSFEEALLIEYFDEWSKTIEPRTLMQMYTFLKSTIRSTHNIDISSNERLLAFLKQKNKFFRKSKYLFTATDLDEFVNHASDESHLDMKVTSEPQNFLLKNRENDYFCRSP